MQGLAAVREGRPGLAVLGLVTVEGSKRYCLPAVRRNATHDSGGLSCFLAAEQD